MKRTLATLVLCAALAACAHRPKSPPPTIEKTVTVYVDHPIACPPKEERERLRQLRPAPLRTTPMPDSVVERDAKTQAQLGKFEAEGGYADQVDKALDRCQLP